MMGMYLIFFCFFSEILREVKQTGEIHLVVDCNLEHIGQFLKVCDFSRENSEQLLMVCEFIVGRTVGNF